MVDLTRLLALSSKFPNEALTLQEVSELAALAKSAAEELKEIRDEEQARDIANGDYFTLPDKFEIVELSKLDASDPVPGYTRETRFGDAK